MQQRQAGRLHEKADGRGGLPMAFESFEDITDHLPHFIEETDNWRRLRCASAIRARSTRSDTSVAWQSAARSLSTPRAHSTQLANSSPPLTGGVPALRG